MIAYRMPALPRGTAEPKPQAAEAAPLPAYEHPLVRARMVLGGRFSERGRHGPHLDGRPASLRQVIEAANRLLAKGRQPQIAYPGVTPLPELPAPPKVEAPPPVAPAAEPAPKPALKPQPHPDLAGEPAAVYWALVAAAATGAPCPSNIELARLAGISAGSVATLIRRLARLGHIGIAHPVHSARAVTIAATGTATAPTRLGGSRPGRRRRT